MTTWRTELNAARLSAGDDTPIVRVAPSADVLDVPFDAGYGGTEGPDVLVWSETHVYFPVCYDGAEWLGSAPRHPREDGQDHVGGG